MRGDSRQGWRAEATTQRGWRHGQRCARVLNRHHAHMECANAVRGDSRQGWRAEATTQRGWRHGQRCARALCYGMRERSGQRCA